MEKEPENTPYVRFKSNLPTKIQILDLNFSAFQHLHGNTPELELQGSRVIFLFHPDENFHRLSALYNENAPVNVLDYVNALRQLRAMMFSLKGGQK